MSRSRRQSTSPNFLPMVDAVTGAVSILIVMIVLHQHSEGESGERPQADLVMACERVGPTPLDYQVRFAAGATPRQAGPFGRKDTSALLKNVQIVLESWPHLAMRIALHVDASAHACAEDVRLLVDQERDRIVEAGRTGLAVPIFSVVYKTRSESGAK